LLLPQIHLQLLNILLLARVAEAQVTAVAAVRVALDRRLGFLSLLELQ
jgi:hypothetical protein